MRTELDPRVVRSAQRGDEAARAQVVADTRRLFERVLQKRGVLGEAREDILQEALTVIVQQLCAFEWRAKFETWALAVLFRTQQRYRESEATRSQRYTLESEAGDGDEGGGLERVAGGHDDPARTTETKDLARALADCAAKVPLQMREVWLRHRIKGQEHHEIAKALALSINTVGTRIYRVDHKMRDCMERKGFTPEVVLAAA